MFLKVKPVRCLARMPRTWCRAVSSYPPKVRAYPFAISPKEAIMDLALAETVGEGLFSRILIPLLKSPPFEPEKIVPVYFPAWFIDAEVEFNASVTSHQGAVDNGRMTAVFLNSYIPGHTMDTLSTISLLSENLAFHETVPFSADLETQYETKIQCLPFKTAPLSIIDEAKSLQPDQLVVSRKLRIDPSSISPNLLCAYPVLIPLYLAQYAVNWGEDTDPVYKTALIEAHSVKGRIIVENVPYQLPSQEEEGPLHADNFIIRALERQRVKLVRLSQKLDQETTVLKRQLEERGMGPAETNFLYLRGKATPFHNLSTITTPPTWDISNIQGYMNWLESFMTADGLKQLVTTGDVGMDDPRIRPFTVKELKGVRKFLALGQERSKAYDLLERISKIDTTDTTGVPGIKSLQELAASCDTHRENATPSWWKEWESTITQNKQD